MGGALVERLCDPSAKVSAHYTVDEDGTVYALVPEDRRAWHAGVSHWAGVDNVKSRSIGIELVNPGHEYGYRAFPEAQVAALIALGHGILMRHPDPARARARATATWRRRARTIRVNCFRGSGWRRPASAFGRKRARAISEPGGARPLRL